LTPKMLIYIGRFIGKIALEYLYTSWRDEIFDKRFDEIRHYVRHGTTSSIWPIMLGRLSENLLVYKQIGEFEEQRTLYAYSLYEDEENNMMLFNFDIGIERYSIILDKKFPHRDDFGDSFVSALCKGLDGFPEILYCKIN